MATTLLDAYNGVLREINRYQAPVFETHDFSHHWNRATDLFAQSQYLIYELKQQQTDAIRQLKRRAVKSLTVGATSFELPKEKKEGDSFEKGKYWHFDTLSVSFVYLLDHGKCKKGDEYSVSARRLTNDMEARIEGSHYFHPRPEEDRVYYSIEENTVRLRYSRRNESYPYLSVKSIELTYLKEADKINLLDDYSNGNQVLEFSDMICQDIISLTATRFLENASNTRVSTHGQISPPIA